MPGPDPGICGFCLCPRGRARGSQRSASRGAVVLALAARGFCAVAVPAYETEGECHGHPGTFQAAHPARRHHAHQHDRAAHRPELYHCDQRFHYQYYTTRIHRVAGDADPARQVAPVTIVRRGAGTGRRNGHDYQDGSCGAAEPAIQPRRHPGIAGFIGLLALCSQPGKNPENPESG